MKTLSARRAFTLLELVVSMSVLLVIATMLMSAVSQSGRVLQNTSGKIEQFREARQAFEAVTRRLAEATLNTYWDYTYKTENGVKAPTNYTRQSELRFRSGRMEKLAPDAKLWRPTHGAFFQAPAGSVDDDAHRKLDQALNTWGFFIEVGTNEALLPSALVGRIPVRHRSRLMELREPTEVLSVYQPIGTNANGWFSDAVNRSPHRPVRVLSENIVALVIHPRLAKQDELARRSKPVLSPRYEYDSTAASNHQPPLADPDINPKNQLPPVVQVVMVAIDELTADRLADKYRDERDLGIKTDDLFLDAKVLEDNPSTSTPGDGDLQTLEQRLIAERANYRIFSTNVAIRGAKWSRGQAN
jgi:uncharacterized protein (TIGR02599 family)